MGTLLQNQLLFRTHLAKGEINRPDHLVLGRTWKASRRGNYKCVVVNRGVLATLFLSIPSDLIFSLMFF